MRNNNKDKHALDFSSSPFGKGKIIQNNNIINNPNKIKQNNGTNVLQYNNNDASDIRGFDIGSIKWIVYWNQIQKNLQKHLDVVHHLRLILKNDNISKDNEIFNNDLCGNWVSRYDYEYDKIRQQY
eukprot:5547_1